MYGYYSKIWMYRISENRLGRELKIPIVWLKCTINKPAVTK